MVVELVNDVVVEELKKKLITSSGKEISETLLSIFNIVKRLKYQKEFMMLIDDYFGYQALIEYSKLKQEEIMKRIDELKNFISTKLEKGEL